MDTNKLTEAINAAQTERKALLEAAIKERKFRVVELLDDGGKIDATLSRAAEQAGRVAERLAPKAPKAEAAKAPEVPKASDQKKK